MFTAQDRYSDIAKILLHINSTCFPADTAAVNNFKITPLLIRLFDKSYEDKDYYIICWVMVMFFITHHLELNNQMLPSASRLEECIIQLQPHMAEQQERLFYLTSFFHDSLYHSRELLTNLCSVNYRPISGSVDVGDMGDFSNIVENLLLQNIQLSTINKRYALSSIVDYINIIKKLSCSHQAETTAIIIPHLEWRILANLCSLLSSVASSQKKTDAVRSAIDKWRQPGMNTLARIAVLRTLELATQEIRTDTVFQHLHFAWCSLLGQTHPPAKTAVSVAKLRSNLIRTYMDEEVYSRFAPNIKIDNISRLPIMFFG